MLFLLYIKKKEKKQTPGMEKRISALQPLNMHTCAGVDLKSMEEWCATSCDTYCSCWFKIHRGSFRQLERSNNQQKNAHCSCVLTTADSDNLYVLEEFQAPEKYHHSFTYGKKMHAVSFFFYILLNARVWNSLICNYSKRVKWESKRIDCSIMW